VDSARRKAGRYLDGFYGPGRESRRGPSGDTWFYHGAEVTRMLYKVNEVTLDQLGEFLAID
jgi:hypothetical protein